MARPFSIDLGERVVSAVVRGGVSCRGAARRFGPRREHGGSLGVAFSSDGERGTGSDGRSQAPQDRRGA